MRKSFSVVRRYGARWGVYSVSVGIYYTRFLLWVQAFAQLCVGREGEAARGRGRARDLQATVKKLLVEL